MVRDEAMRLNTLKTGKLRTRPAEDLYCSAFRFGFELNNESLKHSTFYFVESALTKVAQSGALDEKFKRNVEKLKPSSTFTDAFRTRARTFFCFVRPVAKYVCDKIKMDSYLNYDIEIEIGIFPFLPPTSFECQICRKPWNYTKMRQIRRKRETSHVKTNDKVAIGTKTIIIFQRLALFLFVAGIMVAKLQ